MTENNQYFEITIFDSRLDFQNFQQSLPSKILAIQYIAIIYFIKILSTFIC